jgi:hypothetical protein
MRGSSDFLIDENLLNAQALAMSREKILRVAIAMQQPSRISESEHVFQDML